MKYFVQVAGVEVEVGSGGTRTIVRGYDQSHRLFRGRRVEAYVKVTAGDIAGPVSIARGARPNTPPKYASCWRAL